MYFIRKKMHTANISKHISVTNDYYMFTECSKGTLRLYPFNKYPFIKEGDVTTTERQWQWMAECWIELSSEEEKEWCKNNQSRKSSLYNRPHYGLSKSKTKLKKHFSGYAPSLYEAAIAGLQRLFTARRQPLCQLMQLLINDQAMYELSRIGEP